MSIKDEVQKEVVAFALYMANVSRIDGALRDSGLGELEGYVVVEAILCADQTPGVRVGIKNDEATLDAVARKLAAYGKVTKDFDQEFNHIGLSANVNGVRVKVMFTPPETCTVERVEEEVDVEEKVIPAHKEKRTRFVLKGDCGPLLKPQGQEVEA